MDSASLPDRRGRHVPASTDAVTIGRIRLSLIRTAASSLDFSDCVRGAVVRGEPATPAHTATTTIHSGRYTPGQPRDVFLAPSVLVPQHVPCARLAMAAATSRSLTTTIRSGPRRPLTSIDHFGSLQDNDGDLFTPHLGAVILAVSARLRAMPFTVAVGCRHEEVML